MLRFEHKTDPMIAWSSFLKRFFNSALAGLLLIAVSLLFGMEGYRWFEGLSWVDSFENAAMLLSGMGPLWQPVTVGGKIFAGVYALYSGLAVLVIAGITFAPVIHRFLHYIHADDRESLTPD